MKRFNKLSLVLAVAAFSIMSVSAFAQNGVPTNNNVPDTFIDENGDGVCDTYQAGGQGQGIGQSKGQGGKANGRGNGVADSSQAKTQQRLRDGSKAGGSYGQGSGDGTGSQTRRGGSGKGRGGK
ncbi:MAG: hypothetical protein HOC71_03380 [Candidatus Latescibacteria bacterium]|jgi:hypothetical protein|nr:hypothetical protein [Candidatus Latescibacterota bacterium]